MESGSRRKMLLVKLFFVYLMSLLILSFPTHGEAYSISWTPGKIEQTIALGAVRYLTVTFTSNIDLENAELWVVPELQPFIILEPARFETVEADKPQEVKLRLFVPPNFQAGAYYDGAIHLKVGSQTYHQTLKVGLNVVYSGKPAIFPDETRKVTAPISPEGGTISTEGADGTKFTLTFPPAALLNPEEITLTPALSVTGLPLGGSVLAAVHMGPPGLMFEIPASLTIESPAPWSVQNRLVGFVFQDDGTDFSLIPAAPNANIATLQIDHFTGGGLMEVTDQEILNLAINAYYGTDGVIDTLLKVNSCGDQSLADAGNKVLKSVKLADLIGRDITFNPMPCIYPGEGELCSSVYDLGEAAKQSLENVITDIFVQADNQCTADPSKEVEAMQCIVWAERLDNLGVTKTQLLADGLADMKTCGLYSLSIEPGKAYLSINETKEFEAFARDKLGNRLENRELVWKIDNPGIASFEPNESKARVTGKSKGTTFIEVYDKMSFDLGVKMLTLSWVQAPVNVGYELVINPPAHIMHLNDSQTLTAFLKNPDGGYLKAESTWSCGTCSVATVEPHPQEEWQASVSTISGGTETITARHKLSNLEATATITVPVEVTVTPDHERLAIHDSKTLTATVTDTEGNPCIRCTLAWYSNNTTVAGVDASGLVIGKGEGQATISAVSGDAIGVASIEVFKPRVTVLPDQATIDIGNTRLLTATVTDSAGNPYTGCTVEWFSNNLGVANVTSGLVTGISQGVVTISAVCGDSVGAATIMVIDHKTWSEYPASETIINYLNNYDSFLTVAGYYHHTQDPNGNHFTASLYEGQDQTGIAINRIDALEATEITRLAVPDINRITGFFVDKAGNMFVMYNISTYLVVRRYSVESDWDSTPTILWSYGYNQLPTGQVSYIEVFSSSDIAADDYGNAIITWVIKHHTQISYDPSSWSEHYTIHAIRYDENEGWETQVQIALEDSEYVYEPGAYTPPLSQHGTPMSKVAMSSEGDAILVWTGFAVPNQTRAIRAREYKINTGWGATQKIAGPNMLTDGLLDMVMDPSGNAIVTSYSNGSGTRATHYHVISGWQQSFNVAANPVLAYIGLGKPYKISMDEGGNAMIVYMQLTSGTWDNGQLALMSKRYSVGGGWDGEATVVDALFGSTYHPDNILAGGPFLDGFVVYGNGNATLITRYSETEYLQFPNYPTWYSNGTHTYVHARQYWAGLGWDESVSTIDYHDVVVPVEIAGELSYVISLVYTPFMWAPGTDLSLLDKSGRATIFWKRVEAIDIQNSVYTTDYFTTRFE